MEISISKTPVEYEDATDEMEARVADIYAGKADEMLWFLEHPPLYTAGTSAQESDLINPRFPVHQSGRGGQYTYHGPGQRVVYAMLDLKKRQAKPDIRDHVWRLEECVIRTLAEFGVTGQRREGRVGIWVPQGSGENKIAAIGVRVRHWITFHGLSINIDPDLSHYDGIVPCGISEHGVTSLKAVTGKNAAANDVDEILQTTFAQIFDSA